MKSLHSKVQIFCDWPSWCKWIVADVTFQEYVRLMKQKFVDSKEGEMEIEVLTEEGEEQEQYT